MSKGQGPVLNNSRIKLEKFWSQINPILHFNFSSKLNRLKILLIIKAVGSS